MLPIHDGWNVLDNNLLACPREHIEAVFRMLERQPQKARFTGGLEAGRIQPWHVDWLWRLKPETLWMAYDSEGDWEPLAEAVRLLSEAGIVAPHRRKRAGAYVLMGRAGDTPRAAETRLRRVISLGIKTQAMLYDNGRECQREDMPAWRALRKKFTDAREVGAMVAETWTSNNMNPA